MVHRMRTSRDVVFDESRPFYPCPTTDASPASLPIPHSTLPSSVSSSESPPVVPNYMVKPLVTQFYSRRGACSSDAPISSDELSSNVLSSSLDVSSSPPVEPSSPIDSSSEQFVRRGHHLRRPPDYYSPSTFTATALSEPSYHDVILHLEWQHGMAEEIAALERTSTWDLVPCLPHVHLITCKWVYKVKTHSTGSLERYKARLVAHGFQQEQGWDYDENFAPIAHMTTIHTLLAMASVRDWSISQLDVKNAFLNDEMREDVYMCPPPGYSVPEGMCCHLCCSFYGLKQAPRTWFQCFASVVAVVGFSASAYDPALFVHVSPRGQTLLLLYVDDMIITSDDPKYISFVKAHLSDQFLMYDLGLLR
jgi:hypothetical protein